MSDQTSVSNAANPSDRDSSVSEFCDAWKTAWAVGDEDALSALFADPPGPIAEAAMVAQIADESGDHTPESDQAIADVSAWIELACNPQAARGTDAHPTNRRVSPPLESTAPDLEVCLAGSSLIDPSNNNPSNNNSGVVLYGDVSAADPFAGEMLGVVSGMVSAAGDGDSTSVTVRGLDGVAAPFTVFQQVVLDELGTVIAWEEDGFHVGLYGRGFDTDQIPELLAYAEALSSSQDGFTLPPEALPSDFGEIYNGSPAPISIVGPVGSTYDIHYRQLDGDGLINLSGFDMTVEEFQAFQFFTLPLAHEEISGHDALIGNAWGDPGPSVVTWREPDGFVVRIVGIGTGLLARVRELAEATEELDRDDWTGIVNATEPCIPPR